MFRARINASRNGRSTSPAGPNSPNIPFVRDRSERSRTPDQPALARVPSWFSPGSGQESQLKDAIESGGPDKDPSETMLVLDTPRSPAQKIADSRVDDTSVADCMSLLTEATAILHDLVTMQKEYGTLFESDVVLHAMSVLFERATDVANGGGPLTDEVRFAALTQMLGMYTDIAQDPRFAEAIDKDPKRTRLMAEQVKLLNAAMETTTEKKKRIKRNAKARESNAKARESNAKRQQTSMGPSESDEALRLQLAESQAINLQQERKHRLEMHEAKLALARFQKTLKRTQEERDKRMITWHSNWLPQDAPVVTRYQRAHHLKEDTTEQARARLHKYQQKHRECAEKMNQVMEQISIVNRRPASWEIPTEESALQERRNEIKLAALQEEFYTIASSDKEQLHDMSRQMDMRS